MSGLHSSNPTRPSVKAPMCPGCGARMTLVTASPDRHYTNLLELVFKCDCGHVSEALVMRFDP